MTQTLQEELKAAHSDKQQLCHLILDCGGGGTKAFIIGPQGKVKTIFLESPEAFVTQEDVDSLQNTDLGCAEPEERAWVGVDGHFRVIGSLAESFNGTAPLRPLKYETAIFRALAVLWVAKERFKLEKCFAAEIGILLPASEYSDRGRLEQKLGQALREFQSPAGVLKVELAKFECFPEGGGILLYLSNHQQYKPVLRREKVAIVMLGFRNASVLVLDKGALKKKVSGDLGFHACLERIQESTSGQKVETLLPAVARAGFNVNEIPLQSLVKTTFRDERDRELTEIKSAIVSARNAYLTQLKQWWREVIPEGVELIVYAGGTAEYLRPELEKYAENLNTSVLWHGGLTLPDIYNISELGIRLIDAYAWMKLKLKSLK